MAASPVQIQSSELYAGYWLDDPARSQTSSGGIVSCILVDLLERGIIKGALVSRITSVDGKVRALTSLVKTKEDVLLHGGSSYIDSDVVEKMKELKNQPGRIAVVAIPCQVRAIRALMAHDPELAKKFNPVIGLFCRGNVNAEFYDDFFQKRELRPDNIGQVKILRGHTSGNVNISLKDGGETSIPFMAMNSYRLAGIHAKALCAWCDEHKSAGADISVGDIFSTEFKQKAVKHSAFIPRTDEMAALMQDLVNRGVVACEFVGMDKYAREFAKVERFSSNLAPRYPAAKMAGLHRPRTKPLGKVNPFHVLSWAIFFRNSKLSQSENGRRFLFSLPPIIVKATAFIIKGLSRL
jgi:coenzyme F420 hydrogenase subunit beta